MSAIPKVVIPKSASKKRQIYDALLEQIQNQTLPFGTRIPSAPELADEWQVAYGTMHAALTELTREGWLVRYPKFGTFVSAPPESTPGTSPAKAAVIVLPPREDIVKAGYRGEVFEMMQGLSEGAHANGWQTRIESLPTIAQIAEMEKVAASLRNASGAVFVGTQYQALIERLVASGFPVVTLAIDPGVGDLVTYDRRAAIDTAITHLSNRGYRKIGFVGDTLDPLGKYNAFIEVMTREGRTVCPERNTHYVNLNDASEAIRGKLAEPFDCDAIFAVNYQVASLFAWQAKAAGIRIPEDIAIVTLGIEERGVGSTPLTYVRVPYHGFGVEAAHLLTRNTGKAPNQKREIVTIEAPLVIRGSCGTPLQ